jgi:hypothetical protein
LTATAIEIGRKYGSGAGVGLQRGLQALRDAANLSQAQSRVLDRLLVV